MKKKKSKSKMIYVYLGIIVILFGSIFVLGNLEKDNPLYGMPSSDLNPATRAQLDDPLYQNIILPDALEDKIKNKEDFFVYMYSSTCPYCKDTTPHLVPLAQELGIDLPMFNLQEFKSGLQQYNINYTPTLVYFKNGVEAARLEGGIQTEGTTEGNTIDDFRTFLTMHAGAEAQ